MKKIFNLLVLLIKSICGFNKTKRHFLGRIMLKKKKKRSPRQLELQLKFNLASQVTKPMLRFLPITYGNVFGKMAPRDKAFSYNFKNAIIGNYPNCKIDFDAVKVSRGKLVNSHTADSYCSEGNIHFNWTNLKVNNASDNDISVLVSFCPVKKKCIYNVNGPLRKEEKAKLDVGEFKGHVVHTYLSFMSANGLMNSDSKYTGRHIIN
jgi:hypothetical protein